MSESILVCRPVRLSPLLWEVAAKSAVKENPANAPSALGLSLIPKDVRTPERIAMITSKYWGAGGVNLGVSFLDTNEAALKARILSHMNAWGVYSNVKFSESRSGQVRIARARDGYWSYLGTDILHIPAGEPTMNLEAFTLNTSESEYRRVIRHETGHTLGFPHEHMRPALVARIDPQKAIAYFLAMDGWDEQTVREQVLTPLDESTLTLDVAASGADQASIMCYQLPGSITTDGRPIVGGSDIDSTDGDFAAQIYPKAVAPPPPPPPTSQVLMSLIFAHDVLPGTDVRFRTKVRIPAGKWDWVHSASKDEHEPVVE
jgi:hypothetical protein